MTLRQRSYLIESNYKSDRTLRREALSFYKKLVKYVEKNKNNMREAPNQKGFYFPATDFWAHPKAHNLVIVLVPTKNNIPGMGAGKSAAMGTSKGKDVMMLASLKKPFDSSGVATRLFKDHVVHEIIHYLDPGHRKGISPEKSLSKSRTEYFNNPNEWNAYWHEGASRAEQAVRSFLPKYSRGKNAKGAKLLFVGDGTFGDFRKRVIKYWDTEFLDLMNKKTKRKFDKRLAQMWMAWKKRGLV